MGRYARKARQQRDTARIERAGLARDEYGYSQESTGITIHDLDDCDHPKAKWIVEDEGCRNYGSGDICEAFEHFDDAVDFVLSLQDR